MPLIRHITDTARWVATYRARESERADAVFRDPYAERLAGPRGAEIAAAMPFGQENAWSFTARTWLFDRHVQEHVQRGGDLVINLAAGLDARPYRMDLPASLTWIEADLPDIIDHKETILAGATPSCQVRRVRLDLADADARRSFLQSLACSQGLVLTEGLIIYMSAEEVLSLGQDLANTPGLQSWATDLVSPGLLKMAQLHLTSTFELGVPRMKFAPSNGPAFFSACGWKTTSVGSMLETGLRLNRLPAPLRAFASYPVNPEHPGETPWSGVCRLDKC